MKIFYALAAIILLALVLFFAWAGKFASSFSSGGMGGGEVYKLDCSRQELYSGLKAYYATNQQYQIPSKWMDRDYTKQAYYEDFEGLSFYFAATKTEPKEMYFVTLVKNDHYDTTYTKPSYAAVRIVTPLDSVRIKETEEAQKKRADRRFKENILDKIITDSCSCKVIGVREW